MSRMFPHLCQPIKIGKVELKNRMIAAPMGALLAEEGGGYVTERMKEFYRLRGRGGFALVVVEGTAIRKEGRVAGRMPGLCSRVHQLGFSEVAYAIHEGGSLAAIQLGDPGALADTRWTGVQSLAPSDISHRRWIAPPRAMTEEEIERMLDAFVQAAVFARRADFDLVMIHGCHHLLVSQFMTPFLNRRTDKWGVPWAFPVELIKRMKQAVDCPVYIRISGDDFFGREGSANLEHMLKVVPHLEAAGADAIDISAGSSAPINDGWVMQPIYKPRGVIVYLAEAIKKVVKVPVITAGRLCDPILCENIIARGRADIVSMGRVSYADPEFARKVMEGRPEDIRKCTACDIGCALGMTLGKWGVLCAVNYEMGRMPYEYELHPPLRHKKVMVIGGGVGGMEAARVASIRGHDVTLYEKDTELGGNIAKLASAIPRLNTRDLKNIVEWQIHELEKLKVKTELGKEVTAQLVEQEKPDAVILATGARPLIPEIPGIDSPKVVVLDDYLMKKATVGQRVVVLGGQNGAEVATSLAREKKQVTLVEESARIAQAPYLGVRGSFLRQHISEAGVQVLTETKVKEITDKGVRVIDKEGREQTLEADSVLIALDRIPNKELERELRGRVGELYEIGDCVKPTYMLDAIHGAYRVARAI